MSRRGSLSVAALCAAALLSACSDDRLTSPATPQIAPQVQASMVTSGDAAQAGITGSTTTTCGGTADYQLSVTGSSVAQPLDVVLVIDASGSIGTANFNTLRTATNSFIDQFAWSSTGNRLAIVRFATGSTLLHSFTATQTNAALKNVISTMAYTQGSTYTKDGMQDALDEINLNGRPGAQKIVVLITDGVPNPSVSQTPCSLKPALNAAGVKNLIVGVGSFSVATISCLVDSPSSDVFLVNDFDDLAAGLTAAIAQIPTALNVAWKATVPAGFDVALTAPAGTSATFNATSREITWTLGDVGSVTKSLDIHLTHTSATGGSLSVLDDQTLTFTSQASGTVTRDLADATLEVTGCDSTPPVLTPTVTGTLGDNDWYVDNVSISWSVVDDESPFTVDSGCTVASVTTDTGAFTSDCAASSAGGSATASVTVKRDATAPSIAFSGNAGSYTLTQNVAISCSATDNLSGIAAATCPGASGAAWTLGAGAHPLDATAKDNAGNTSAASTTFTVNVTSADLCTLATQWSSKGGVASSLCTKLDNAQKSAQKGNTTAKNNQLDALRNELAAQSGKAIPADKAALLTAWSLLL